MGTPTGAAVKFLDRNGVLVGGGGIGTLLGCPISVTGNSQVDGNTARQPVFGGSRRVAGLGGGIFSVLSPIDVDQSAINGNTAASSSGLRDLFAPGLGHDRQEHARQQQRDRQRRRPLGRPLRHPHGRHHQRQHLRRQGRRPLHRPSAVADALDSLFQDNTTLQGGGIDNQGTLVLANSTSTVSDNTVTGNGGGIVKHGRIIRIATKVSGDTPDDISGKPR